MDTAIGRIRQLNAPWGWLSLYLIVGLAVVEFQPTGVPPLCYPPLAIGIALLLRRGVRFWPYVLAADFITSLFQYGQPATAAIIATCTVLEVICAAALLNARRRSIALHDHSDLAWLTFACAAGALFGATLGMNLLDLIHLAPSPSWSAWLAWWTGDMAAGIALLPLILVLSERMTAQDAANLGSWREQVGTMGTATAMALVAYGALPFVPDSAEDALKPLIFVPVLWAALRLDLRATCVTILITAVTIMLFHWSTDATFIAGQSLFDYHVLEVQCFLVALTLAGLPLSQALYRERRSRTEAEARQEQLRLATDNLEATSTRFALAAKAANLAVWDWRLEDNSLLWSEQVYEMYRIDRKIADTYQAWLERVHPDDADRLVGELDGAIKHGQDVHSNFRIILPDGEVRHINVHAVAQASAGGQPTHVIGLDYDVTDLMRERLKAEESELRAAAANRAKSEFLAVMSHELRTPLNAIIGFSDLIAREAFGPVGNERYKSYVDDIRNSGQMLLSLINDILDLTRVEAGKLDLALEPVAPREILATIVRLLSPLATTKNLQLSVADGPDCPPVLADRRALRQLLNNLAANGLKFTDAGGVTLSAEPAGADKVALIVTDTGRGIPPERIQDLCKPFVQVADSLRRDVGGIGLGLAISQSLATVMGGTLTIESELGKGTRVRVVLPAAPRS